jgi:hypothetical protein
MSILWTDEGRHMPSSDKAPDQQDFVGTARNRRLAALEALSQRRSRGETEMICRARRRHERLKRRFHTVG